MLGVCCNPWKASIPSNYDLRHLHENVQYDVDVLSEIWLKVKDIRPEHDQKLARLKELLSTELRDKKILIFTHYRDTARYLYFHLGHPENPEALKFSEDLGGMAVRRIDSGADPDERLRIVQAFAPEANGKSELVGTDKEIDILISTDVLSEGQNLQDCGYLVNYDLHWNPTRMVQRAGRIDRLRTKYDTLFIYNFFPEAGLERLLRLVENLSRKIADIDRAGFLDASVPGEVVHPKDFNTLRRIREEDGKVIEEEEQFAELTSNEFLIQQLRTLLGAGGKEMLESLPDGIHSGLMKQGARGIFFYFQASLNGRGKSHFWKFYDFREQPIHENGYLISNLIACNHDTPRVVDPGLWSQVFEVQEKVITNIVTTFEEQQALEAAPRSVDPIQQTIATAVQSYLNHPDVDRRGAIEAIRFLAQPMMTVQVRELRRAYQTFQRDSDIKALLSALNGMRETFAQSSPDTSGDLTSRPQLRRDDLLLVCFDLINGG
jgi:Helicase conserved C-terminal domain